MTCGIYLVKSYNNRYGYNMVIRRLIRNVCKFWLNIRLHVGILFCIPMMTIFHVKSKLTLLWRIIFSEGCAWYFFRSFQIVCRMLWLFKFWAPLRIKENYISIYICSAQVSKCVTSRLLLEASKIHCCILIVENWNLSP